MAERPDPCIDTVPPPPDLTPYIVKTGTQYITGGSFVDVYRCRYDDGLKQQEVAVKALRFKCTLDNDTENKSVQMLRKELGIWKGLNHNNIVPFLGVAYGFGMSGVMSLVSLWMPNETLHKFLATHDGKLDTGRRLQILHDISDGLHYLHSFPVPVVHGDLNPNNVLLDADYTARLANFGHVSLMGNIPEALHYLQKSTTRQGASRWIAPEQINSKWAFDRTTKSDIYSLGCVALQVFSGKQPWSEVREDASIIRHVLLGHKPSRPESRTMNDSHWDLIQRCWLPLQDRPAIDTILYSIQQLLGDYPTSSPTLSASPLSEVSRHHPTPFYINVVGQDMSATPLSALATARIIERLQDVVYPEGVRSPREDFNRDAKDGKFRYDREFLMQFMVVCKDKPPNLPPLDVLGIQPRNQSAFNLTRGSGRHRQPSSAMTLKAHQGSVGTEGAQDVAKSPIDNSKEQGGEVIDSGEIVDAHVICDLASKDPNVPKEALRIDISSMPPPLEIPRRRPGPLDINAARRDLSAGPLSMLATARSIERLQDVEYPEGVRRPRMDLNRGAKDGKFSYDRDFLMQFMGLCTDRPPDLPPLDILGIQPMDHSTSGATCGGSGRRRQPSSAIKPTALQGSVRLGIISGLGTKPGPVPGPFVMNQFSTTSKLTSEERFQLSTNTRSTPVSSGPAALQFGRPAATVSQSGPSGHPVGSNRTRSKRGDRHANTNKVAPSQQAEEPSFGTPAPVPLGNALEPATPLEVSVDRWIAASTVRKPGATDTESPELVDRKVRALLNKLSMEKFDSISDQIISWANKGENEKDGRMLIQVIGLIFERVADEAQWSEMYARLCRKMMDTISSKVQGTKDSEGKPIVGGQLFRKYLLSRCQEDYERGWVARETIALAATNERKGDKHELYSDEFYAIEKAKCQVFGLIKFIGELFKLQMFTERMIHECVKKLLGNVENPDEEMVESLCQLLKTVGQLLDVPKARAHIDVYFTRMKELSKSPNVSPRMRFMLQDVIELRDRKWMTRGAVEASTIYAAHEAAAKEKAAAEARTYRQLSVSKGSRRGGDRNAEYGLGPDDWAMAGGSVTRPQPRAGDLSQFGKISKTAPMVMGPSSVFTKKDSTRDSLSRKSSSSNMFSMLSQKPQVPVDATLPPSLKPSVDPQRKKLRLLPRGKSTPAPKAPIQISEADLYSTNLPEEHRHHVDDSLMATALDGKEADATLVSEMFY